MPRPPDYQNQMGRGGAAGPNAANPLIPKVIRAGTVGKPKTTIQRSSGRYRTETIVHLSAGGETTTGEIIATPADSSGEWIVTAYVTLPSDVPPGLLQTGLAGGVDSAASDKKVEPNVFRDTCVVDTTGPVIAGAGYLPDEGSTPDTSTTLRLVTKARRV